MWRSSTTDTERPRIRLRRLRRRTYSPPPSRPTSHVRLLAQRMISERTETQVQELNQVSRLLVEFSLAYNNMLQADRDVFLLYDLPYGVLGLLKSILIILMDVINGRNVVSD